MILKVLSGNELSARIKKKNLFLFPTERMVKNTAKTCFKRIDCSLSTVHHRREIFHHEQNSNKKFRCPGEGAAY
ncbi:MAG: DUF1819 family protein [Clostridiales bacterium]|nr:DUF1819 family protein [Clostridiales bacterium]